MTTYVPFTPSNTAPFQFNVTLDGGNYTAICPYNFYGQRYYINIYDNFGNLILSNPITASGNAPTPPIFPPNTATRPAVLQLNVFQNIYSLNLLEAYFFTSTMYFNGSTQTFEINP